MNIVSHVTLMTHDMFQTILDIYKYEHAIDEFGELRNVRHACGLSWSCSCYSNNRPMEHKITENIAAASKFGK